MAKVIPCILYPMTKSNFFQMGLLATIFAIVMLGCSRREQRIDIVLVTIDGDVGLCSDVDTSKTIVFPNTYTTSPSTLPAAASVLTGLLPPEHGIRVNGVGSLSPGRQTLATELSASGFECAAFLSSAALHPRHGLTNGFSRYDLKISPAERTTAMTRPPTQIVDAVAEYLKTAPKTKSKFVWVHVSPYAGIAAGIALTNGVAISEAEKKTCEEIDRLFGMFSDKTIKAVVPLFGFEPGAKFQEMSLEDSATRVTVTVSGLDRSGINEALLSIADVKAMLLNPQAEEKSHSVYTETIMPWYVFRLPPLQIVRGSVETLPPLGLDKVALQPLAGQMEMMALKMGGHLGEGLIPAYTNATGGASLDETGIRLLDQAATAFTLSGTNGVGAMTVLVKNYPSVPIYHEFLGNLKWQQRDYTAACNEYAKVSEYGVNMVGAYRQQAMCHMAIGNIPQAIDKAETAFLLNPDDPVLRRGLAQILFNAGSSLLAQKQYQAAGECLNRVYWLEPHNTDAMLQLARLQLDIGQTNAAIGLLNGVMKVKPQHALANRMLGTLGK